MSKPRTPPLTWPQSIALPGLMLLAISAALLGPFSCSAGAQEDKPVPFNYENALASGGIVQEPEDEPVPLVVDGIVDLGLLEEALRTGDWTGVELPEPTEPMPALSALLARAGVNPGVGLSPPTTACFEGGTVDGMDSPLRQRVYRLDSLARPWGVTGAGPWQGAEVHRARYSEGRAEGGWHCGMAAELFWMNEVALENAFKGLCSAIPLTTAGRSGVATLEEQHDFGYGRQRCDGAYLQCVVRLGTGGSPENPITTPGAGLLEHYKVCKVGAFDVPSLIRACPWRVYYRVDTLPENRPWCAATPPPVPVPPPPTPVPVPPPPEPTLPPCGPTRMEKCAAGGFAQSICRGCDCPPGVVPGEGAAPWCQAGEPVSPVRTCIRYTGELYVPLIPSTGKLTLELVPHGEGPCPEVAP